MITRLLYLFYKTSLRNGLLMKVLRRLAIFAIKYNFDYSAVHVEGKRIPKADALSRFRFQVFRALCQNRRRRTNRSSQRSLPRPYIASLDFSGCISWLLVCPKQLTCHTQVASDVLLAFAYSSACQSR